MQQLTTRGQQLQAEEGVGDSLQQDLQSLESTLSKMRQSMDSQEQSLEVRGGGGHSEILCHYTLPNLSTFSIRWL